MKCFVYIIYNIEHDKFYIGQSYDVQKREAEHNLGLSKYTARYSGGWKVVYVEEFLSRSEAMKRERFLKKQKNKDFYRKLAQME
jgi:putative endonuclease